MLVKELNGVMKEKISGKFRLKNVKCLLVFGTIFFMAYILFMHDVFTSDHVLSSFYEIKPGDLKDSIIGGRFVNFFINCFYYFISYWGISHTQNMWVLQVILIFFIALAATNIYNIFSPFFEEESINIWLIVIIALNYCNPFFVESFVYKGAELGAAIWIVVLSVKAFINNRNLLSTILLFTAVSTYQSYIALFFIYVTAYLIFKYYDKINKQFYISCLKMFLVGGISAITNILIVKLAVGTGYIPTEVKKVGFGGTVVDKVQDVIAVCIEVMLYTRNILPTGLLAFVLLLSIVLVLLYLRKEKLKIGSILVILIFLIMINMYPYAIAMVMENVYLPPRVIWPVFSATSMTTLIAYYILYKCGNEKIYLVFVTFFVGSVFFSTQTCILDEYISNALDIYYAQAVQSEIEEYEKKSGYEVTDIYVMHARREQYYHTNLLHFDYISMYNHKIQYNTWSDVEWINFVNCKNYIKHTLDNAMQEEIFEDSNTKQVYLTINSSIQMKFEDNKLYWLVY